MDSEQSNKDESLSPELSLIQTISDAGLIDNMLDLTEIGLDQLLKNVQDETLSQVPIIKSIYSLAKTGFAFRDYIFLKKMFLFVSGFKEVDEQFRKSLEHKCEDPQHRKKVGEELINALTMFDQIVKASLLFKVFSAYVKNEIDYQQFSQYSYVLQNIDVNNLRILRGFYESENYHSKPANRLSYTQGMQDSAQEVRENWHLLQGFISVGLVTLNLGSTSRSSSSSPFSLSSPGKLKCNDFGGKFLQILGYLKAKE